jgi:hypothetical protein
VSLLVEHCHAIRPPAPSDGVNTIDTAVPIDALLPVTVGKQNDAPISDSK